MTGFNKLFYDGRFPGEILPAEKINWKDAVISNGEMKEKIFLPMDYDENINLRLFEGVFPDINDYVALTRGTLVALNLSDGAKNDGQSIFMNANDTIKITVYPNIEPFNKWEQITLTTEETGKSFTLIVTDSPGHIVFTETKTVDSNKTIDWDLSNILLGLSEVELQIRANTNNSEIKLISFVFDIFTETAEPLFTQRTVPDTSIPDSAIIGTINFKINAQGLNTGQIDQATNIFSEEGINGETVLLKGFPFNDTNIPFRPDFKNIAFRDNANNNIKHYILNTQGMKGIYLQIPYSQINTGDINLKAVVYNKQIINESARSIFNYISDSQTGRLPTNISKVDYPTVVLRPVTTTVLNGETVLTTTNYGSEGFKVGNIEYQEIVYIVDYSETSEKYGNQVSFYRNNNIEEQGIDTNSLAYDYDNSQFGLWGGSKVTISNKKTSMHMESLRSPNNGKSFYLHDLWDRPNYSVSSNGYTRQGDYLVFRSQSGNMRIPFVVSMQNPYASLFNTEFKDSNYSYTPK